MQSSIYFIKLHSISWSKQTVLGDTNIASSSSTFKCYVLA